MVRGSLVKVVTNGRRIITKLDSVERELKLKQIPMPLISSLIKII